MKHRILSSFVLCAGLLLAVGANASTGDADDAWAGYLDYAYIYSSASPRELGIRLDQYAREAGVTLDAYMAEHLENGSQASELDKRRRAIGNFLQYLATGRSARLEQAWLVIRKLEKRLDRHENRYWHRYIDAHRALDTGDSLEFTARTLRLWNDVIVDMETSYETYQTLSLNDANSSGFAAALPYLYENVARLVLIRSQRMGARSSLDPLAAVVRFLADDRLGAYPDVIDPKASSREYLDAIVARLDGPESDGGSLSFTLALFEAGRYHDLARARLASEGFSSQTLDAVRLAVGAYQSALSRARTLQGQTAVYSRVLRQLGEIHAAKQRLGVDPEIEIPFSIARAIKIYAALDEDLGDDWEKHGYHDTGRESYVDAMHGLWEEIQEASFNVAAYYHDRGVREKKGRESLSDAVSTYSRYFTFFKRYAKSGSEEGVPDSAFFAAHDAARGIADAILQYDGGNPSTKQLESATGQYLAALEIFPFEPGVWSSAAVALERQGRDSDYLGATQGIADRVSESRVLESWIGAEKESADYFDALRRAVVDDLAVMYLGFSSATDLGELEQGVETLRERRTGLEIDIADLRGRLALLGRPASEPLAEAIDPAEAAEAAESAEAAAALPGGLADMDAEAELPDVADTDSDAEPPAQADPSSELPGVAASGPIPNPADAAEEIARIASRIDELDTARVRLDEQIEARARALPLFKHVIESDGLALDLSAQRTHPVHSLVRRMYVEGNADKETR
jgi:hypothetical protein